MTDFANFVRAKLIELGLNPGKRHYYHNGGDWHHGELEADTRVVSMIPTTPYYECGAGKPVEVWVNTINPDPLFHIRSTVDKKIVELKWSMAALRQGGSDGVSENTLKVFEAIPKIWRGTKRGLQVVRSTGTEREVDDVTDMDSAIEFNDLLLHASWRIMLAAVNGAPFNHDNLTGDNFKYNNKVVFQYLYQLQAGYKMDRFASENADALLADAEDGIDAVCKKRNIDVYDVPKPEWEIWTVGGLEAGAVASAPVKAHQGNGDDDAESDSDQEPDPNSAWQPSHKKHQRQPTTHYHQREHADPKSKIYLKESQGISVSPGYSDPAFQEFQSLMTSKIGVLLNQNTALLQNVMNMYMDVARSSPGTLEGNLFVMNPDQKGNACARVQVMALVRGSFMEMSASEAAKLATSLSDKCPSYLGISKAALVVDSVLKRTYGCWSTGQAALDGFAASEQMADLEAILSESIAATKDRQERQLAIGVTANIYTPSGWQPSGAKGIVKYVPKKSAATAERLKSLDLRNM